ncbi:MAG TPA: hypothetical protein DCZ72_15590 [Armatimonadetes bacterium]|nr:hypothetical protein [Armatimonadota bacterium]
MTDHYTPEDIDRAADLGDQISEIACDLCSDLELLQATAAEIAACPASPPAERELFPAFGRLAEAFAEATDALAQIGEITYPGETDRLHAALAALVPAAQDAINILVTFRTNPAA